KQPVGAGDGVSEYLRRAIVEILGLRVKFIAKADASAGKKAAAPQPKQEAPADTAAAPSAGAKDAAGWAVAEIPGDPELAAPEKPAKKSSSGKAPPQPSSRGAGVAESRSDSPSSTAPTRYGESVVRELLGASFIEEQESAPRVVPLPKDD
ncbi:MAG: hypothetical protein Q8M65_07465, partial [Rhodoglobus sp.]|nr:hypothetical protein [Rhodoglobus sp.]